VVPATLFGNPGINVRQSTPDAKIAISNDQTETVHTTFLVLTPINYPETGQAGVGTAIGEVKRTISDGINPTSGVQGNNRRNACILNSEAVVLIALA